MNATKNKILKSSLILFNERGVSSVSLRDIADKAEISVGNLQYHFKKRESIVESLYFQLVEKINSIIILNNNDLLKSFFDISVETIKMFYEYRFVLLDFVTIIRNNQKIKTHYAGLSVKRKKEFLDTVNILIDNELLRKELLKNEYQNLYKRIEVIGNFWLSSVLIHADSLSEQVTKEYILLVSQSIYPYLTEEAKKNYLIIFPDQFEL